MIGVWLGLGLVTAVLALGAAYFAPPLMVRHRQVNAIRRRAEGRVALTFDDGPDRELTPMVLDMLAAHGVKATFFLVGSRAQEAPEVCDRIVAEGHEVATHSHHHRNAWRIGPIAAVRDAERAYESLRHWCPANAMFRPPFGKSTAPVLWAMKRRGAPVVWWTHVAMDTSDTPPEEAVVVDRVLRDGGVLLMHCRHLMAPRREYLLRLLTRLLQDGRQRGVAFCTTSELLST